MKQLWAGSPSRKRTPSVPSFSRLTRACATCSPGQTALTAAHGQCVPFPKRGEKDAETFWGSSAVTGASVFWGWPRDAETRHTADSLIPSVLGLGDDVPEPQPVRPAGQTFRQRPQADGPLRDQSNDSRWTGSARADHVTRNPQPEQFISRCKSGPVVSGLRHGPFTGPLLSVTGSPNSMQTAHRGAPGCRERSGNAGLCPLHHPTGQVFAAQVQQARARACPIAVHPLHPPSLLREEARGIAQGHGRTSPSAPHSRSRPAAVTSAEGTE